MDILYGAVIQGPFWPQEINNLLLKRLSIGLLKRAPDGDSFFHFYRLSFLQEAFLLYTPPVLENHRRGCPNKAEEQD